jgi:hypothetical protein
MMIVGIMPSPSRTSGADDSAMHDASQDRRMRADGTRIRKMGRLYTSVIADQDTVYRDVTPLLRVMVASTDHRMVMAADVLSHHIMYVGDVDSRARCRELGIGHGLRVSPCHIDRLIDDTDMRSAVTSIIHRYDGIRKKMDRCVDAMMRCMTEGPWKRQSVDELQRLLPHIGMPFVRAETRGLIQRLTNSE